MSRGYVATSVGAILFGFVAELLFILGYRELDCLDLNVAECFVTGIIGAGLYVVLAFAAMWLAASVGAWGALRIRNLPHRVITATILAMLLVPWGAFVLWLLDAASVNVDPDWVMFVMAPPALILAPALTARAIALRIRRS